MANLMRCSSLCAGLLSSLGVSAANLPELGATTAPPKADAETCQPLQQDFDIDLKQVVKAGCEPSTEQIAKLMDNPVGNLVLLFNQFDYTALKGPHSNGTRYLGKYSFMPTFPISLGEDWNLINRLPISYVSAPVNHKAGDLIGMSPYGVLTDRDFPSVINDPFDRTSGFGDLAYVRGVFAQAADPLCQWCKNGLGLWPYRDVPHGGKGRAGHRQVFTRAGLRRRLPGRGLDPGRVPAALVVGRR